MKKRLIAVMALISGFCLSLGLTACTVDGRNDRFVFEPNENGYTLTDYIGAETQADIPAEHDGKPVTEIGDRAFSDRANLKEVAIPDSVTKIGANAFDGCHDLEKIVVAEENPRYGSQDGILYNKDKTEFLQIPEAIGGAVTIPDSIQKIGDEAFHSRKLLTDITISAGVTEIGQDAFGDCAGLASIRVGKGNPIYHSDGNCLIETTTGTLLFGCKTSAIPDDGSVTKIGRYAFEGCSGLTEITIPDSVTEIGRDAFCNCSGLTKVHVSDLAAWCGIEFEALTPTSNPLTFANPLLYAGHLYLDGEEITELTIPSGVTKIGRYAFEGCSGLTEITIPDSVTEIGERAFAERMGLTQVTLGSEVIGRQAFYGCTGLAQVTLGDGVAKIGDNTFDGCSALGSITVEDENAHYSSQDGILYNKEKTQFVLIPKALKGTIAIPDSVTEIGERAFAERTRLTQVTIDSEVIGRQAFDGCTGLVQIALGDGVTEIGEMAFRDCTGLTQVTIDSEVIGRQAFYGCTGLAQIMLGDGVTEIGQDAFALCTGITSIRVERGNPVYHSNGNCLIETDAKVLLLGCNASDIPDDGSVTEIGHDAFAYCTGLTEIAIPDSVEKIQDEAFVYCTGLTKATIGSGVTEIGGSAFKDCWRLVEVWNRSELRIETNSYGLDAFKVYLTDEASKQGQTADGYLFYEDGEISCLIGYVGNETELILPANSPNGRSYEIYQHALHGDTSLKEIAIPDNVTKIGALAFGDCTKLIRITIGKSVTEIGKSAFENCSAMEKIIVGEENAQYSSQDGILYDKEKTQFVLIPKALKGAIAIPDSVTEIGERAFADRTGLTQVAIGSGVAKIGDSAFDGCSALESITVKGENTHYSSQDGILYNKAKTEFIHVPKAIKGAVTIPDSMKKIEGKAFSGCEGLTQVTIGSGVSRIESGAFEGCSNLQRVIFQKTSGWVCFDGETDVRILPTDLEDGETAALYLKFTYSDALWRRTD